MMLDTNILAKRGQALEDEYFRRVDQELIRKCHEALDRERKIAELARITGVDDLELVEQLLDVGIDSTTVAALALTPLVFVAWADGTITGDERQSVVSSAMREGISDCTDAFNLVQQWLNTRPRKPLWEAWKHYAKDFHHSLPGVVANKLAYRTIFRATRVAKASGGVMGFGNISDTEQRILDEIAIILPERDEAIH